MVTAFEKAINAAYKTMLQTDRENAIQQKKQEAEAKKDPGAIKNTAETTAKVEHAPVTKTEKAPKADPAPKKDK